MFRVMRAAASNWKTTLLGVIQALVIVLSEAIYYLDGDPTTTGDWNLIVASVVVMFGLILGRDFDKSTEQQELALRRKIPGGTASVGGSKYGH